MSDPMDGRCEDYANDPAVVYHAHDLPRCKNVATVQIDGRWLCNVHARLDAAESKLAAARTALAESRDLLARLDALHWFSSPSKTAAEVRAAIAKADRALSTTPEEPE